MIKISFRNYVGKYLGLTYLASGFLLLKFEDLISYCEFIRSSVHFVLTVGVFIVWLFKAVTGKHVVYRKLRSMAPKLNIFGTNTKVFKLTLIFC